MPVLGDLPLIGRFFQGKGSQNVKRNLLVFVTGRIVRPDGEPVHEIANALGTGGPSSVR